MSSSAWTARLERQCTTKSDHNEWVQRVDTYTLWTQKHTLLCPIFKIILKVGVNFPSLSLLLPSYVPISALLRKRGEQCHYTNNSVKAHTPLRRDTHTHTVWGWTLSLSRSAALGGSRTAVAMGTVEMESGHLSQSEPMAMTNRTAEQEPAKPFNTALILSGRDRNEAEELRVTTERWYGRHVVVKSQAELRGTNRMDSHSNHPVDVVFIVDQMDVLVH